MSDSDHAHLEQLRRQYNRRLQLLESQAAQFGIYAPPHVQLEIEDINTKLADIDTQLGRTEDADAAQIPRARVALTEPDLQQFVYLLLETSAIADRETREAIIRGLPPRIANSIVRSSVPRVDVANIVRTTLNYENGLDALIAQVRFFEEDSISMRKIDKFLRAAAIVG